MQNVTPVELSVAKLFTNSKWGAEGPPEVCTASYLCPTSVSFTTESSDLRGWWVLLRDTCIKYSPIRFWHTKPVPRSDAVVVKGHPNRSTLNQPAKCFLDTAGGWRHIEPNSGSWILQASSPPFCRSLLGRQCLIDEGINIRENTRIASTEN